MANIRYIVLFALAVFAAVAGVLLQKDDDAPAITFTRPDVTGQDLTVNDLTLDGVDGASIVPSAEPFSPQPEQVATSKGGGITFPIEESLSDEQLAEQIKLAQAQLAQVESLNQRKQKMMKETILQQDDAEQSLMEAELAYVIGGWRQAWRDGDAHTYFNFYSDKFVPSNGKTMSQWKEQRVKRLNPEHPIDLTLKNFVVKFDPETQRSLVTFEQLYKSGGYKDSTKKRLILANEDDHWKIVSETTQ